jgi:hypothetical protein
MVVNYLEAILTDGIHNPNFFNGRILTAQDLQDEQAAQRERARRLGMAIGEGVAYGLNVQDGYLYPSQARVLNISAGLAVNRRGEALLLNDAANIPLVIAAPATDGRFPFGAPCDPPESLAEIIANGFVLLAITSAVGLSPEKAAHTGLNPVNPPCVARYEIEGVQLKLISLAGYVQFATSVPPAQHRSRLTHRLLGTPDLISAAGGAALNQPTHFGLLDQLREEGVLTDCDVPLAVLNVGRGQHDFVDVWSVRRPCSGLHSAELNAPEAFAAEAFAFHSTPRRRVEAQAFFSQFQAQLETLEQRTASVLQALKAEDHFVYLPAAGFLPRRRGTAQRFRPEVFFNQPNLTAAPLDAAYIRHVLNESFAIDPIPVTAGQPVPVKIYEVTPNAEYVIFVRTAIEAAADEPEPDTGGRTGTVIVTVVNNQGQTLRKIDITSVDAVKGTGGKRPGGLLDQFGGKKLGYQTYESYGAMHVSDALKTAGYQTEKRLKQKTEQAMMYMVSEPNQAADTGSGLYYAIDNSYVIADIGNQFGNQYGIDAFLPNDIIVLVPAVYTLTLSPGTYTINVVPAGTTYQPGSASVTIAAGQTKEVTVTLQPARVRPGGDFQLDEGWVFENGYLFDKVYVDPKWKIPVDPPPLEWEVNPPPVIRDQLEGVIGTWIYEDPLVANHGTRYFVNPDYNPAVAQDEPYAFVATGDGGLYPMVLVASDYSLAGDVPADRGGLTDLDGGVLRAAGLGNLDALAAAPAKLVAGMLGTSTALAKSAVSDAQIASTDLQTGFQRYAGVDKAASDRLLEAFGGDVGLANASPDAVKAALGEGFNDGFAARLIEKARAVVPTGAWSLDVLGLNDSQKGALFDAGIASLSDFVGAARGEGGASLLETLKVAPETFDSKVTEAATGIAAAEIGAASKGSLATVEGMTGDRAAKLVAAGIKSTADLAGAKSEDIAAATGATLDEAAAVIAGAREKTGGALEIGSLKNVLNLDDDSAAKLTEAGITTVADLSKADTATLSGIVNDASFANKLNNSANLLLNKTSGFKRMF